MILPVSWTCPPARLSTQVPPFQGWFVKVGERLCERTVNLHLNMNQMSIGFHSMSFIHLETNSKSFWFVKINCQLRLPYINNTLNVLFLFDKLLLHNFCPFNLLTLNCLVIGLIFVYGWEIRITNHWKPPQDADQQLENQNSGSCYCVYGHSWQY